jgi:hypothetical protein
MSTELVIAAYDAYLDWLDDIDKKVKVTVYRKGDESKQREDEILIKPNQGRCVHTFFNHIYTNYDNLSDYTFFAQDYPFDHWENIVQVINDGRLETYEAAAQLKIEGYYGYHFNTITIPSPKGGCMWNLSSSKQHGSGKVLICNSDGSPQDSNPNINVDFYWKKLFTSDTPNEYEFMPGGHFGITKKHAQLRSKDFYKQIIDLLLQDIHAPWIIERLECYIFNPKIK